MTLTRARTIQYIGILLSLGLIAVGYWYFSVRAGVKTNSSALQSQGVGDLSAGLAGYWKLDETTGSTAADASTNGNNGTLTNMENGDWATGQIGNGLTFDGVNEYVVASAISAYDMGTNPFSLAVWFKTTDTSGAIVAKGGTNSGGKRYYIGTETADCSSGKLKVDIDDDTTKQFVCSTTTVTDNAWHHVMLVRTRTALTLFLDGKPEGTPVDLTGYGSLNSSRDFYIGGAYDESSGPVGDFSGLIDEVRLYSRDLSADEISNLYRLTTPTGVDTSLKGYWSFNADALSGTTAYDWSGAGNSGTLTNGPTVTKGQVGQALSFDGSNDYVVGTAAATADIFTYSAWINPSTNGGTIIGTTSNGIQWRLSTGKLNLVAAGVTEIGSSTETVPTNTWTHVSITNDASGNYTFYINGHDAGGRGTNAYNYDNQRPAIGSRYHDNASELFTGSIDEVRVYNRALTAAEIKSLYDRGAPDKTNSSSSQAQGTGRLDSDLRAYYPLDNGSGTTATDASTNGRNGTLTNGPTWTTGQIGGAVSFDGSDDYIGLPAKVFGIMPKGTASFWVKGTNYTAGQHFIYEEGASFNNFAAVWPSSSSSSMTLNVGGNTAINTTKTNFSTGTWYQIAISWDGTTANVYVDGALDKSVAHGYNPSTTSGGLPQIGRYLAGGSGGGYFNGSVDEFRVYARVLSAEDIAELYRLTSPTGVDTSLKGYWSFNGKDMNGTTTYDRSGLGSNGTLTNGPAITNSVIGQGLSFDGTNDYVDLGVSTPYQFANTTFTVTGWFKSGLSDTGGVFAAQGGSTDYGWWVGLNNNTNGVLAATLKTTDGGQVGRLSTRTGFNDNNWHQFAFVLTTNTTTYAGNSLSIYADGVLQSSTDNSAGSAGYGISGHTLKFGARHDGGSPFFTGGLDEIRIYNRALTAAEIQGQYDTVKPEKINSSATQAQGVGRLDSGLAGYWKLDENTGTSAADASTNGSTGTLTNGPTWMTGQIGSGIDFDGVNDTLNVGSNSALNITNTSLTISAWIYPQGITTTPSYHQAIFDRWDHACTGLGYSFNITNLYLVGNPTQLVFNENCGGTHQTVATGLVNNVWQHVAVSVTNGAVKFYVNGSVIANYTGGTASAPLSYSGPAYIGNGPGAAYPFNGGIDEVRVYNRGLSADEISQLYRLTNPTGTDTSLKGYWSFNGKDMNGTTAYDRSGAGNNGTLTNGPAIINGKLGQALYFDGNSSDDLVTTGSVSTYNLASITVSAWVKATENGSGATHESDTVVQRYNASTYGWKLGIDSSGKPVWLYFNNEASENCTADVITSTGSSVVGGWHHLVGVRSAAGLILYVDGVQAGTDTQTCSTLSASEPLRIGNWRDDQPTNVIKGNIDEVRIYNRALTATEVQSLYSQSQ